MAQPQFLTSPECQKRASECRSLAAHAPFHLKRVRLLSYLADCWEALAIEIELFSIERPSK
jgi:hypothetical protein